MLQQAALRDTRLAHDVVQHGLHHALAHWCVQVSIHATPRAADEADVFTVPAGVRGQLSHGQDTETRRGHQARDSLSSALWLPPTPSKHRPQLLGHDVGTCSDTANQSHKEPMIPDQSPGAGEGQVRSLPSPLASSRRPYSRAWQLGCGAGDCTYCPLNSETEMDQLHRKELASCKLDTKLRARAGPREGHIWVLGAGTGGT